MTAATAVYVTLQDCYETEMRVLRTSRHNVLVEGPAEATDIVLGLLRPHICVPLLRQPRRRALKLPRADTRGLILQDVSTLTADEQTQLLAWLRNDGADTQVVSTTTLPLFGLVAHGRFDAALYYRLNVLLLQVGASKQTVSRPEAHVRQTTESTPSAGSYQEQQADGSPASSLLDPRAFAQPDDRRRRSDVARNVLAGRPNDAPRRVLRQRRG